MNTLISEYEMRNHYEREYYAKGFKCIAGVDEVGRGPLAGVVTVAAVILDPQNPIYGLKDSKKLSRSKIKKLAVEIRQKSLAYAIVSSTPQSIDKYGISVVIKKCMKRAVAKLEITPSIVFVDHERVLFSNIESISITKGDDKSNTIAAASILAKDARDAKMIKLSKKYPEYDFASNVGYGTKKHLAALDKHGPIKNVHRYSFKPIRKD